MKNFKEISTWLFNPFKYIAGSKALIIGLLIILVISFLGYLTNTHFDGVLDIHYGCIDTSTPYIIHLCYQLINWVSIIIVFYLTARIFSKSSFRFIDIAGTLAIAQAPLIFATFVGFYSGIHLCFGDFDVTSLNDLLSVLKDNITIVIVTGITCTLIAIWSIVLKYYAYTISTNIKGVIGGVSFAVALIVSEIVSKTLLFIILPLLY